MAGFYQQNLKGSGNKMTGDPYLRDFTHASKTFLTAGLGNAPKLKYLFHVYFEINDTLVSAGGNADFPDPRIPGLLVKNINLPKYTPNLVEMNQYNRKRYVQTKITYDPVSVVFHDDNNGSMKKIWYNYYTYYYNDSGTATRSAQSVNVRNTYDQDIRTQLNWGYNGEDTLSSTALEPKPSFFRTVKIFGFNQHNFVLYTLINPMIDRWEHDTYDYYQSNGIMENRMTLKYETVTYADGALNGTNPDAIVDGFGTTDYYDRRISPITRPGGNATVMGKDGLVTSPNGYQVSGENNAGRIANRARRNVVIDNSMKRALPQYTAQNNKVLAGARGVSNTPGNSRGRWNIPAPGANAGGRGSMQSSGMNVEELTQPPPIDEIQEVPPI